MTFDKWASKTFLTIHEAADYLSVKSGESQDGLNPNRILGADVLRSALDGNLRLVVDVQTGTEDGEGRPIEAGLWDLPLEGAGRQQVEYDWRLYASLSRINMDGIAGAVVERDGVQRQLDPIANLPSAIGAGCVLGVRREALDTLLKKTPPADDRDSPLGARERDTLLIIINALVRKSKIDMSNPTRAAKTIVAEVELFGGKMHWQTVDDKLKQVKELIKWLETQEN